MELLIVAVIVALAVAIYLNRKADLDVNKDGKVDAKDAVAAVQKVEAVVVEEVKKAEEVVVAKVKKTAAKAKTAAKKVAAKKTPKSKKA